MKQIKNKKEKGVTLIALVVTIIVLIVLAGISINLVFGQLGVVTKSKEAKEENLKQTAKDVMNLKITNIQIENYTENETNKNENYSLEEQVIGKWIDGKNIYRKTIKIDVNNNTNYTFDAKSILSTNIGSIINTYGYSVADGGTTYASFPCYYTEKAHLSSFMDIPTGKIHIYSGEQYKTATHYLTFEYTKTTD